jgi:hypothetical protein
MVLLHLQCPSGAPLRYAVCHAACSSSSFLTAATVFFTPLRSFLPSFRFITPRSQLNHLLQGRASQATHKKQYTWECTCLSASHPYNTHRVPFRFTTSFIHFSSVQSTRCPLLFCSPAAPLKAAFTLRLLIAHVVPPFRKASLRFTCIVQPPPYPDGKFTTAASYGAGIAIRSSWLYCQPLCGGSLSASVHSFLILSGGHLTARQHHSADKCAARLCFFFAAGAFTGRLDTFAIASKKALLIYR